jgi:hypothetical protein
VIDASYRGKGRVLVLVVDSFAAQEPRGGGASRGESRTDSLQEQRLHESRGSGPLLQRCREIFGRLVREIEGMIGEETEAFECDLAVGAGRSAGRGMDFYAHAFKKPEIFQCFPAAQHSVPNDWIMIPKKGRVEGLRQNLLPEEIERAEPFIGNECPQRNSAKPPSGLCHSSFSPMMASTRPSPFQPHIASLYFLSASGRSHSPAP